MSLCVLLGSSPLLALDPSSSLLARSAVPPFSGSVG